MTITARELQAHAEGLADRLAITLRYWTSRNGQANARTRIVDVPRIVDALTYGTVLHELGHVETQDAQRWWPTFHQQGARINTAGEAAAWRWARAHALVWTPEMQADMRHCLQGYLPWATGHSHDPIFSELDRMPDGRLTIGYARAQHRQALGLGPLTLAEARTRQARIASVRGGTWAQERDADRWRSFLDHL